MRKGCTFFCTAAFPDEIDFLVDELKVDSIKIASADIDHIPLLKYASSKKVNIQIDTGSGNLWEIEKAVDVLSEKQDNLIIHHCPTGYPARLDSIHLRMIPALAARFADYVIAYSDHSPGWEMDMAAISLGVKLIEKTITLDATTPEIEHGFSLEPDECIRFVESVRDLEKALGKSDRVIPDDILEGRKKARRSINAAVDIKEGEEINERHIDYKRPGYGISPADINTVVGKKAKHDIPVNHMITLEDIE